MVEPPVRDGYDKAHIILLLAAFIAAAAAAGFTGWQAWIANKTGKGQLRAYMYATPQDQIYAVDGIPETNMFFRNGGQTPADELRIKAAMRLMDDRPTNKDFATAPIIYIERPFLEPSAEIKGGRLVSNNAALDATQLERLRAGKSEFYVWGTISYDDVFENRHQTHFCFRYGGVYPSADTLRARFRDTCLHPKND